jgi:hypothetical protein
MPIDYTTEKNLLLIPDLENRFTYHAPKLGQPETYSFLRDQAKNLAYHLVNNCPPSRELSLALTKLEEVVFWANASIARQEGFKAPSEAMQEQEVISQ